jgi:hypothetical protein
MTELFNLSTAHFHSLLKQKLPLDCIYLLEMINNGEEIDSEEFLPLLQRLQRKGYISAHLKMTEYGNKLYNSLFEEIVFIKPKQTIAKNDKFSDWWTIFPATNDFEINGKHFQGSQKKNIKREECHNIFNILCNSFSPDDIIAGTNYHIQTAKEISFKKKENQLTYIPNSLRYLKEKYFEGYIEKAKKVVKIETSKEFEI